MQAKEQINSKTKTRICVYDTNRHKLKLLTSTPDQASSEWVLMRKKIALTRVETVSVVTLVFLPWEDTKYGRQEERSRSLVLSSVKR